MKELYELLESYMLVYLPLERGYSKNTVLSYYTSVKQFLSFLEQEQKLKRSVSVLDFNMDNVSKYLLYIERQGKSITTRNQRLAGLVSFVSYCAMQEPVYQNTLDSVKKIKMKKPVKRKLDFLTIEEYKALISAIDLKEKNGLRYYVMINLLYDTAARVSEFTHIKVEDLNYGSNNSIRIFGKGKKFRNVYISDTTVKLINDYMKKYEISSGYLFRNKRGMPLSRFGVEYIINKYYEKACKTIPSLKAKNVTPHTLRHTKACHFLMNGTALPVIQKFLGHSSVQTTEIYLDVTSDAVIKAVDQASKLVMTEEDIQTRPIWHEDNIIRQLNAIFSVED